MASTAVSKPLMLNVLELASQHKGDSGSIYGRTQDKGGRPRL